MSDRTLRGLSGLASFRELQTRQLEALMFAGSAVTARSRRVLTSRILRRLRARGFVDVVRYPSGGHFGGSGELIHSLTEAGGRYLARAAPAFRGVHPPQRDTASIEHALMAADVYIAFLKSAHGHPRHELSAWDPDWCAAQLTGATRVVPDGHLVYRTETWELDAFIEIDLGSESPARFGRKVAEYVAALRAGAWQERLPTWPLVLTVTPSRVRATSLRAASEKVLRLQPAQLFDVALFHFAALEDLLAAPDPLGPIWQLAGRQGLHALIPAEPPASSHPDRSASGDRAGDGTGAGS